jgi:hypothetical protein
MQLIMYDGNVVKYILIRDAAGMNCLNKKYKFSMCFSNSKTFPIGISEDVQY